MSCDCYQVTRIAKTRKPHRCEFCGETIPVGSSAHIESGKGEGGDGFWRTYCCERCWPLTDEFWDFVDGACAMSLSGYFADFLAWKHPEIYREVFGDDD